MALTPKEIETVIRSHLSKIRMCFEKNLLKNPQLQGRVGVHFIIDTSGKVKECETKNTTLNNSDTETCINNEILTWIFPTPRSKGTVSVIYPFVFTLAANNKHL